MSLTLKADIREDNLLPGAREREEQLNSLALIQQNHGVPSGAQGEMHFWAFAGWGFGVGEVGQQIQSKNVS